MTNEERDLIARFVARVGGAAPASGFAGGAQSPPALPPIDREADQFIGQQFEQNPEARYRITQMAFVQEAALAEAQNRMRRMEWELQQARQAPTPAQPAQQPSRGLFGGLFGGGQSAPPPGSQQAYPQQPGYGQPGYGPPPPQYPPQYQPGMFQRPGGGFLGSALTTAAGVAGGVVLGNALMDMFSGHGGGGIGGGFAGPASETTVINNYGSDVPGSGGADPWAAGGAPPDPGAGPGPWSQDVFSDQGGGDPGAAPPDLPPDQGGFDQGGDPGWDNSDSSGGGWDDNV